jgi:hypothetical protein
MNAPTMRVCRCFKLADVGYMLQDALSKHDFLVQVISLVRNSSQDKKEERKKEENATMLQYV